MINNFPCGFCSDEVGDNDEWNEKYEKLKKDPQPWYYSNCAMDIPFSTLSN